MDRRMFLGTLAGGLLAAPLTAAETPGPPPCDRVLIKALGLTIPSSLLQRADQVIQ